jgi:ABC-2 type transport system permease protein
MFKSIIHLLSFFSKEVNEIIRQPRLVLSLILGPFLVLLLFGLSYNGGLPQFRVAVVVPANSISPDQTEQLKQSVSANFDLVSLDADEAEAMDKLRRGEVDLVQILPTGIGQNVTEGKQSMVEFKYSEVNPFDESWVKYLGIAQINEMNHILLENAVTEAQSESGVLTNLSPQTLVSPLALASKTCVGNAQLRNFYAPSVLAHLAAYQVTLGALSIVREKERGTLEMFHISPVSPSSIILGKYLGYTLFLIILAVALLILLIVLGTPFLGSMYLFVGLHLLLIAASLGIGFLISCLSNSDSTAVQLSMLCLNLIFQRFLSAAGELRTAMLFSHPSSNAGTGPSGDHAERDITEHREWACYAVVAVTFPLSGHLPAAAPRLSISRPDDLLFVSALLHAARAGCWMPQMSLAAQLEA